MSVRSKDELLTMIGSMIGEDTADESLHLLEDVTDTLNDLTDQVEKMGNYKKQYEENDAMWRKRYQERFFSSGSDADLPIKKENDEDEPKITFESLFKED